MLYVLHTPSWELKQFNLENFNLLLTLERRMFVCGEAPNELNQAKNALLEKTTYPLSRQKGQ